MSFWNNSNLNHYFSPVFRWGRSSWSGDLRLKWIVLLFKLEACCAMQVPCGQLFDEDYKKLCQHYEVCTKPVWCAKRATMRPRRVTTLECVAKRVTTLKVHQYQCTHKKLQFATQGITVCHFAGLFSPLGVVAIQTRPAEHGVSSQ